MEANYRYTNMTCYTIDNVQYIPTHISSHKVKDKIVVHFDRFDGKEHTLIERVGKIYVVESRPNETFAEITIANKKCIINVRLGRIEGLQNNHKINRYQIGDTRNIDNILSTDREFRYQTLKKLTDECEYFLKTGYDNSLWTNDIDKQLDCMRKLYMSFTKSERPDWISLIEIENYEQKLKRHQEYCGENIAREVNLRHKENGGKHKIRFIDRLLELGKK